MTLLGDTHGLTVTVPSLPPLVEPHSLLHALRGVPSLTPQSLRISCGRYKRAEPREPTLRSKLTQARVRMERALVSTCTFSLLSELGTISGCSAASSATPHWLARLHICDGNCRGRKAAKAARIWVCQPHSGMVASAVGWIAVGSRFRRAAELDFGRPSFPPRQLFGRRRRRRKGRLNRTRSPFFRRPHGWQTPTGPNKPSQGELRATLPLAAPPMSARFGKVAQLGPLAQARHCCCAPSACTNYARFRAPPARRLLEGQRCSVIDICEGKTIVTRLCISSLSLLGPSSNSGTAIRLSMRLQYDRPVMLMYPAQADAAGYPWLHLHELPRTCRERGVPCSVVLLHPRLDCGHATARTPERGTCRAIRLHRSIKLDMETLIQPLLPRRW